MINLQQPYNDLNSAFQRIRREWDQVRSIWTDQVAVHFEKESWSPMFDQTEATLDKLKEVAGVIDDIKHKVRDL